MMYDEFIVYFFFFLFVFLMYNNAGLWFIVVEVEGLVFVFLCVKRHVRCEVIEFL